MLKTQSQKMCVIDDGKRRKTLVALGSPAISDSMAYPVRSAMSVLLPISMDDLQAVLAVQFRSSVVYLPTALVRVCCLSTPHCPPPPERSAWDPDSPPVPLRIKLAALWASLLSCYIYGGYFELFQPGQLTKMISGHTDIGLVSQGVLLGFAILLSLPALMIFFSLVLPRTLCRWVTILLALIQIAFNSFAMQGSWHFYIYRMVVDIFLCLTIIWYAARWAGTTLE